MNECASSSLLVVTIMERVLLEFGHLFAAAEAGFGCQSRFLLHGRYCPARQFKQLTTPIPSTMNEPVVPTNLVRKHKTPTGDKCQFLLAKEQSKLKTVFSNYLSLGQFELARGIFQHLKRYKDSENPTTIFHLVETLRVY